MPVTQPPQRRRFAQLRLRLLHNLTTLILTIGSCILSISAFENALCASTNDVPNIVLILADDLGYGDLGCFGQQTLRTPRLDAMAGQGLRLTQFYAGCTVCAPSRSVLMTGKHGGHTVVRGNATAPVVIEPGQVTVASLLKAAGYATGCVGKWGVGTPDDFTNPNDVGFDHFFGYVNMWHAHNFYPEFLIRNGKVQPLENVVADKWKKWQDPALPQAGRGVAVKRLQYAPDLFIEDALRFIRENRQRPFFLYFAMNVPHANNEAGDQGMEVPDLGEFAQRDWPGPEKGFAAMIRNIDRDTGRIVDLLRELKIDKDTLVLFTSDNGPHQEGGHRADHFDSNGNFRGIKRDLYEGGIRVPTIAWWPGTIQPGRTSNHVAYFGDVMATVAELAGADPPQGIDSISFAPTLIGQNDRQRQHDYLYWEFYERGSRQAVRFDHWKAIRQPLYDGEMELYDLSQDAGEDDNVAADHPDLVKRAARLMDEAHVPDPNWKRR